MDTKPISPSIAEIISEKTEEALHLEFKTLADSSGERLTKDDRRAIAKAVCGMANAEGGSIVIGVETMRADNVDVAIAPKPIANVEKLRNLVQASLPEWLSPQHPGITVSAIHEDGAGFLKIDVPSSDGRPHHSNVHHQYFRRGSDGTRVMEHLEIRELMFAVREGSLEIDWRIRPDQSGGNDLCCGLAVILVLRNTSRVPLIAPYIRFSDLSWSVAVANQGLVSRRRSAVGTAGIYADRGVLVHIQDELEIAERLTGLDFRRTGQQQLGAAVATVRREGAGAFAMAPSFHAMMQQAALTGDHEIEAAGLFGAENATAKQFCIQIKKMDLFEKFCALRGMK